MSAASGTRGRTSQKGAEETRQPKTPRKRWVGLGLGLGFGLGVGVGLGLALTLTLTLTVGGEAARVADLHEISHGGGARAALRRLEHRDAQHLG